MSTNAITATIGPPVIAKRIRPSVIARSSSNVGDEAIPRAGNEEWHRLGDSRRYGQPKRTQQGSDLAIISHESGPRGADSRVTEHAQPLSERGDAEKTLCGIRPRSGFYGRWTGTRRFNALSEVTCAKCRRRIASLDATEPLACDVGRFGPSR